MNIKPLAFESFGVRSMSTYVETKSVKILIDPGVALAPRRYGLPPHPVELKAKHERWQLIKTYAEKADVIIITHYHFDHFNPFEDVNIYNDKTLLTKHPLKNINLSQKKRSFFFLEQVKNIPSEISYADGETFTFKQTTIKFSHPVYHGSNPKLGYVNMVLIEDGGRRVLHTSDVEGPTQEDQTMFILQSNPDILIVDGPMTYMLGYRFSVENLNAAVRNLIRIIDETNVKHIIIEHHALREVNWKQHLTSFISYAEQLGVKVNTAAEYTGSETLLLEALRRRLYSEEKQP